MGKKSLALTDFIFHGPRDFLNIDNNSDEPNLNKEDVNHAVRRLLRTQALHMGNDALFWESAFSTNSVDKKMKKLILALCLATATFGLATAQEDESLSFIQGMISRGIFAKTNIVDDIPTLTVKSKFYESDFESQEEVTLMVFSYYNGMEEGYEEVAIVDTTGSLVGRVSSSGLELF